MCMQVYSCVRVYILYVYLPAFSILILVLYCCIIITTNIVGQESGYRSSGPSIQGFTKLQLICQPGLWSHLRLDWGRIHFCWQMSTLWLQDRGFQFLVSCWPEAPQQVSLPTQAPYTWQLAPSKLGSLLFSCSSNFFINVTSVFPRKVR